MGVDERGGDGACHEGVKEGIAFLAVQKTAGRGVEENRKERRNEGRIQAGRKEGK